MELRPAAAWSCSRFRGSSVPKRPAFRGGFRGLARRPGWLRLLLRWRPLVRRGCNPRGCGDPVEGLQNEAICYWDAAKQASRTAMDEFREIHEPVWCGAVVQAIAHES